jgi:cytochrome c-type biogenesis protein CcmH
LGSLVTLGLAAVVAMGAVVVATTRGPSGPATIEERVSAVAAGLRCPECQNLSVADSPSGLARQMRAEIARQLRAGQTPDEIRAYFVDRYGEWILLSPRATGLGVLPWAAPLAALVGGAATVLVLLRRRRRAAPAAVLSEADRARIDRELAMVRDPE